jgi:hypothetical protein
MTKETELDFPRSPLERLKKLVKSFMESGKLKPPTIDEWHLPISGLVKVKLVKKEQDDEGKVSASGWTEKQILKKGDKFTTPYTKGVHTYDPVGLTNIDGEEKADDRNT